jgi:hypothetical protein
MLAVFRRLLHPSALQVKLSKDPKFVEKLWDIVALYLDPPEKALVPSVYEKSQIQALERTRPLLPLGPGIPARQSHDYRRHGNPDLQQLAEHGGAVVRRDQSEADRRGSFENVSQLIAAIEDYLAHYNEAPKRFVWTKDAEMILSKVARCREALLTPH